MKRAFRLRDFLLEHTNPIIRYLILADIVFFGAVGLLTPIFSIFVIEYIRGGTAAVAGIAIAVYLVTRSVFQVPAARIMDRICGDTDDFWFMFGGLLVSSLVPLSYFLVRTPEELYVAQFVYGLALAFYYPSFYGLFTKYIPENKEATAWSIYQTFIDISSAVTAAAGGILATAEGFGPVLLGVAALGSVGALALLPIRNHLRTYNC
jgi:MFS family permease